MDSRPGKSNHTIMKTLAQLNISGSQVQMNILPNEMLKAILSKVQVHHLIPLRSVSSRWKAVIEDICRDKKCLVILMKWDNDYISHLSRRFNGHFKLDKISVFIQPKYYKSKLKMAMCSKLCILLPKLFPHIEQLFVIDQFMYFCFEFYRMLQNWSSSLTTLALNEFSSNWIHDLNHVNQLTKLKILDLMPFTVEVAQLLAPTLARLEHLSASNRLCINESVHVDITEFVQYLGKGLTSLGFTFTDAKFDDLTALSNVNPRFVSTLECWSFQTSNARVVPFVCDHFASLKMLNLQIGYDFNKDVIVHLARLAHLTELRLGHIDIDLATFDLVNMAPLYNVRIFSLVGFRFITGDSRVHQNSEINVDIPIFVRILSTLFPSVEQLIIKMFDWPKFGELLELHLKNFANLISYDFGLVEPTDRLMD